MKTKNYLKLASFLSVIILLGSCAKERSTATGWEYNNANNGGFEKFDAQEQETGPGLVFIEGGSFTMGSTEQDVMGDWNNSPKRTTVSSFYIDRFEVTNMHWTEYMNWMKRVYYKSYPHVYKKCLPDTLVWRSPLSYREKFVDYYLRHPSYRDYPVVGVSWLQANDFCKWRTDRVNEAILVREGILDWHFTDDGDLGAAMTDNYGEYVSTPENMFSTENYLNGNYNINVGKVATKKGGSPGGYVVDDGEGSKLVTIGSGQPQKQPKKNAKGKVIKPVPRDPYRQLNYDPLYAENGRYGNRRIRMEDGMLLPKYRLPTEAEWEFAALGLIGNLDPKESGGENVVSRRIYPWDGHYVRKKEDQWAGSIRANFIRGKGDYMGVSGALNDGADVTARVDAFWPNDYGLYHMAGNVSEWVMDVYRPTSNEVTEDFMPFRGNVYTTQLLRPEGLYDKPVLATDNLYDVYGMKEFVNEFARAKYLALTGGKNEVQTLAKESDPSYISNYLNTSGKNKYLNFSITPNNKMQGGPEKVNGNTLIFVQDTLTLELKKADKIVKPATAGGVNYEWELGQASTEIAKTNQDSIVTLYFEKAGEYNITLKQPNGLKEIQSVKVFDNQKSYDDYIDYINSQRGQILGSSRQDPRKFKFNTPQDSYIYGNSKYSKTDSAEFCVLDDINALLDTAIYLYNQGNATKASHYIEVALFGNNHKKDVLKIEDYRKSHYDSKTYVGREVNSLNGFPAQSPPLTIDQGELDKVGLYFTKPSFDYSNGKKEVTDAEIVASSAFANEYLEYRFKNFQQDPNVTSWILTLRNGLTEFVKETRGQQRWRNVTEDENAGRLNYRKDDYINYLDGDLESSIYYNNQKTIDDINNGKRDPKQVVYQSEFENYNLEGKETNKGASGWPITLISDKSRVYKGGSWADRAFWLSPGNRRFLDEEKSTAMIGFRCAMDRLGSTRANSKKK